MTMANHGVAAYRRGCRCDDCRAAISEYQRRDRAANPEKYRERDRRRREGNPEKLRERERRSSRKYRETNPEKRRETIRKYQAANPEKRRKYYAANRARAIEYSRKWVEANPDRVRENLRKWVKANPDKVQQVGHTRRARKRGAFVEYVSPQAVFDRDGWSCHICGKAVNRRRKHPDPLSVSLDHVIPLARGGEHSYTNCATAHLECNLRKHAKMPA